LPDSFSDLRRPNTVIPDRADEDRRLYCLRYTGQRTGYDKSKRVVDLSRTENWRDVYRLEIDLVDQNGVALSWSVFGNPWPYRDLEEGQILDLVGRVAFFGRKTVLNDVEVPPSHAVGKIWVKYLGIPGRVAGERVEALVRAQLDNPDAFKHCAAKLIGGISLSEQEGLKAAGAEDLYGSLEAVIRSLHLPTDLEDGWTGKEVANKLAAMAVQAGALRHNLRHAHPDAPIAVDLCDVDALARTQPEALTASQRQVATDLVRSMRAPKPMNTLLSGDVGAGKTLAYLIPAVAAHRAGAQVSIIAPTSILADQIARQIVLRFGEQIKGVERIEAGGKIADHASILVGTPGLTSVAVKAKYSPNLLICDEQHKMGTAIREKLIKPWTHTLDVSATPVPRSLASALFGGKEILHLRECPYEKKFNNLIGDLTARRKFGSMLKWAIETGQRAAVIYPRVRVGAAPEAADALKAEAKSVLSGAQALEEAFPGKVVAIHGGMKDAEIAAAIESVRSGAKPLMVASTVIETGVDIPSIAAMVVRDADWFGISQLHQLRGRLVRHGGEGWFAMMVQDLDALDPTTHERLKAIAASTDGYELAEKDLVLRGFGDLEGDTQSGVTDTVFRLVKLRPEDFLRKKLSRMAMPVEDRSEERAQRSRDSMQARMFA